MLALRKFYLYDVHDMQCNLLENEPLAFSKRKKFSEFSYNLKQAIGQDLTLLLSLVQCSNDGCSNIRKRIKGPNDNLLQNIQEHSTIKLNEDIQFHFKNTFR